MSHADRGRTIGLINDLATITVPGTSVTVAVPEALPTGRYLLRVLGLTPTGASIGAFSDAVLVLVQ